MDADNVKKTNKEINSHIQMPKLLLKRFHNETNRFFYYDVVKKFIGKNGSASSMNTKLGYYSQYTEEWLRDNIETPFGDILNLLEKVNFDDEEFTINANVQEVVKDFIYALIARDPELIKIIHLESIYMQFLSLQNQHDYATISGIEFAKKHRVFEDYIVTFMINRTSVPLVLPICGLYNYIFNGHDVINLPISPTLVITLIHNSYADRVINEDGNISIFTIDDIGVIMRMNKWALLAQEKRNWGCVICSTKDELERLSCISKTESL